MDKIGNDYFDLFEKEYFKQSLNDLDVGCGSGRWAKFLAERSNFKIDAIDPSNAVFVADKLLGQYENVRVSQAGVDDIPFEDETFDLVFSLGVLHHIPDTEAAMKSCVKKLKKNGKFLVYLYYKLDNRGLIFKVLFKLSALIRYITSKMPLVIKKFLCACNAIFCYMPFVLLTRVLRAIGVPESFLSKIPLSYYSKTSFQIIRNDSLDRFGTPLEQRFTKEEITNMMKEAGLSNITFSDNEPYWHAFGIKK